MGADRRHVGRARHQHADRRILRPPAPLRAALFRAHLRPPPHRLLAARLLRLLARLAPAPAARRRGELLHHQGQLVGDQSDALRPLLVGGAGRQPGACPHLQQSGRRLQCRDQPARLGRDLAQFPRQGPCARKPALLRLWRWRRRADRRDARAPAADGRLPGAAGDARGQCPVVVRCAARHARSRRPAGLGRRDVSGAPSRHADHAGAHEVSAPAGGARADCGRDAGEHGRAPRCAAGALAGSALAHRAAQRVPRHPARIEHSRGL